MRYCLSLIFLLISLFSNGQIKRELAEQAMNEGRFEDALKDYQDLYERNFSDPNYQKVLDCYVALQEWKSGINFIQKHLSKVHIRQGYYLLDQGYFNQNIPDTIKAMALFNAVIEEVKKQPGLAYQYSERAKSWGLFSVALALLEAAENENAQMKFDHQKAVIYAEMGMLKEMYISYLNVLQQTPSFLPGFQNVIRFNMNRAGEIPQSNELKREILLRIRAGGDISLNNLLIWILTQEGNFSQAFTQTKALYLRGSLGAIEILNLAQQARLSKKYSSAIQIYEYLIHEGDKTPFLTESRIAKFTCEYHLLEEKNSDNATFENLVQESNQLIPQLRGNNALADLYLLLAKIELYQLHQPLKALEYADNCAESAAPSIESVIESQLLRGDIELSLGRPYDALLTYAKVESNHSSSPLGQEARFRKGKVAFYTGKFEYAQTIFDVLKHSTSKLIANDAMRISLLIKDNSALDTTYVLLEKYASILLLIEQNDWENALQKLESLQSQLNLAAKDHPLQDEVLFAKADLKYKQGEMEEAATLYLEVANRYPHDVLADESLLKAAKIYQYQLYNPERALEIYEELILQHSNSIFTEDARKEFRTLRGDYK